MALYEYECEFCGKRMEVMQNFSDPPPVCESCGGVVKKLLSAPAVQFKGSGWYVNDYGRGGKVDTGGAAEKAADKAAEKAGEKKSDAAVAGAATSESKSDSKSSESKSDSKSSESKSETSSSPAPAPSAPAKSEGSSGTP